MVIAENFKVNRIVVHPEAALSLQSHQFRSEHWIAVEGTVKVTLGEDVKLIGKIQLVDIPVGAKHHLENTSKKQMVLIEVQMGSDLDEDDIVSCEDLYSRQ